MKALHVAITLLVSGLYAVAQHTPATNPLPASDKTEVHNHDHNTHEDEYGAAVSYTELKKTLDQLDRAREATAKYRDARVAEAEGYRNLGGMPGIGLHFVLTADPDAFELEKPPILIYEEDPSVPGGYSLAGLSYLLKDKEGPDGQPVNNPFPKPLAMWHKHEHICIFKDLSGHTDKLSEDQCTQQGGHFVKETQWMIHAWVWKDSPLGVFSPKNPRVSLSVNQQAGSAQ
jgi:hypothetical protein